MAPGPLPTAPLRADAPTRSVSLRALLAGEIMVSTLINIAFNFLFAWLLFPIGGRIALWGAHGLALDAVPASFVPAVMMTFAISAIIRRRLRGGLHVTTGAVLPVRLPGAMILRAPAIGLLAVVLVALPTVAVLAAIWNDAWGWAQLIPLKLAFSLFHAAIVTPIVVLAALGDGSHQPSDER